MGKPQSVEPKLFYTGVNLADRIPPNHPLRLIKETIPFSLVRNRVANCYGCNGHESLDPALILKLLFLLFYQNVRSERELMRQLPYRMDWLWFCDLDLDDSIPDHSVLSKARRRWGLEVFEGLFAEVLSLCAESGLIDGRTVYADSTVLKADASVDSRIPRCLWEQMEKSLVESDEQDSQDDGPPRSRPAPPEDTQSDDLPQPPQGKFNTHTVSRTDPDSATTRRPGRGVVLGYRDHCLVDDRYGVVTATIATAADYDDAALLQPLLEKQKKYISSAPDRVVGDSSYGTCANYEFLRGEGIKGYLKLRRGSNGRGNWLEKITEHSSAAMAIKLMRRRLHTAEGRFAEAHVRYDHRRCRWRRRWRVQIQCYLVAIVQNIGKLLRYGRWPGQAGSRFAEIFRPFCLIDRVFRAIPSALSAGRRRFLPIKPPQPIPSFVNPR